MLAFAVADTAGGPSLAHIVSRFTKEGWVAESTAASSLPDDESALSTFPKYAPVYVATHKEACRVARYSPDGQFVATGGADCAMKILDTHQMARLVALKAPNARHTLSMSASELIDAQNDIRPVFKTYTDHTAPINDVDFHPTTTYAASCSRDRSIRLFDYSRHTKRANRQIDDVFNIRSINFHPTGDFLLVGTEDPPIRIYDVNTLQAYVNIQPDQHHTAAVTMVRWSPQGNVFVSSARDGSIKVWDTVSCQCVRTIRNAHTGASVSSVCFDARGTHVLSSGQDNTARLWDIGTGELVTRYDGGNHSRSRLNASFSSCGEFVLMPDETKKVVNVWDKRRGDAFACEPVQSWHSRQVKFVATSPTDQSMVTCSDDGRARFWMVPEPSAHEAVAATEESTLGK